MNKELTEKERAEENAITKKQAKQFAAFITDVAETMQKHGIYDLVAIFGMNGYIRNTYLPLQGEKILYGHISDAFNEWLRQGKDVRPANHNTKIKIKRK